MKNMTKFKSEYLEGKINLRVLDVGSRDICGSYRGLFKEHDYTGFDIVPGKNVDIIDWEEIEDNTYDVVISGQAFEHVEHDFEVMREIERVLKPGAICCIIAPSKGPKHCLPDYRRYQTNDLKILAERVGLFVIRVVIDYESESIWDDCVLVASKR